MSLTNEAKVGMFFIISIVLLGLMLEIGNRWKLFDRGTLYTTFLSSSTGLKQGDSVKLSGVDVGTITKISIVNGRVQVDFEVKPGTHIKQDSVAGIRMSSMLGGQFLGITFGTPASPDLPAGSIVKSTESSTVDALMDSVGGLTRDAKQMILELNRNQNEVMTRIVAMLDENRVSVRESLSGLAS
ncbi:MAG: MlaD family protein, partial [Deltaproteobacteria bacterium]